MVASSALASTAEFINFDVPNNTQTNLLQFALNGAPNGGGGAVFWDVAAPVNLHTATKFDENTALYGACTADLCRATRVPNNDHFTLSTKMQVRFLRQLRLRSDL